MLPARLSTPVVSNGMAAVQRLLRNDHLVGEPGGQRNTHHLPTPRTRAKKRNRLVPIDNKIQCAKKVLVPPRVWVGTQPLCVHTAIALPAHAAPYRALCKSEERCARAKLKM